MTTRDENLEEDESLRLGEVLDFMRLLWGLDHQMNSVSKRMSDEIGVTSPQRLVIRIIGRFPGVSAGRLAEILLLHPSTLTGVLKRLETRGLIERKLDPEDGRRALFGLTALGLTYDERRAGTVEHAVRKVLSKLPRAKLLAAQTVIAALTAELSDSITPRDV